MRVFYQIARTLLNLRCLKFKISTKYLDKIVQHMQGAVEKILNVLQTVPPDKKPSSPTLLP